jgi:7,8-dihydroneopterin aldolase/epimerase/oxygenase
MFRVGVPDAERAQPQRLLISLTLDCDFAAAARGDDLTKTINYDALAQRVTALGQNRSWNLIETLAVDIAELVLREFAPTRVGVEIKKFILPNTQHVAVKVIRPAQ